MKKPLFYKNNHFSTRFFYEIEIKQNKKYILDVNKFFSFKSFFNLFKNKYNLSYNSYFFSKMFFILFLNLKIKNKISKKKKK